MEPPMKTSVSMELKLDLKPQTLSDVIEQADRAGLMMKEIRAAMLAPTARKPPPVFNASQVAALCEVERGGIAYRIAKADLPGGTLNGSGTRREFSLTDCQTWVRAHRPRALRPAGSDGVTIAVANFKGGVGKTTTAMTLAQGLSLRGHNVLAIDCDPQGSLTTLFGILPDTEVSDEDTILPVCLGHEDSIMPSVRRTYWSGVDLVAAAPLLFGAEFALPSRQQSEDGFEFWNVLNLSLNEAREIYDVIIFDTPPSLSYVTVNALMAADGLVMPLPPNALDAASAAQFWRLFSDLASQLVIQRSVNKEFDFIRVLLTRVDNQDSTATVVRDWIGQAYEGKVLPAEIPKTAIAAAASAEFGTVYDIGRYDGNQRTYKRALEAYDKVTELIEQIVQATWRRHAVRID